MKNAKYQNKPHIFYYSPVQSIEFDKLEEKVDFSSTLFI